jgi:hypothetical protein
MRTDLLRLRPVELTHEQSLVPAWVIIKVVVVGSTSLRDY